MHLNVAKQASIMSEKTFLSLNPTWLLLSGAFRRETWGVFAEAFLTSTWPVLHASTFQVLWKSGEQFSVHINQKPHWSEFNPQLADLKSPLKNVSTLIWKVSLSERCVLGCQSSSACEISWPGRSLTWRSRRWSSGFPNVEGVCLKGPLCVERIVPRGATLREPARVASKGFAWWRLDLRGQSEGSGWMGNK